VIRIYQDREALPQSLNKLTDWASTWGMAFKVKKCMIMHFGAKNPLHQYSMNGEVLKETNEERDIGVRVSNNLKLTAQCNKAAQTAMTVLGQLRKAFHFCDRHTFVS
jgi:hypothetical protein